MAFDPFGWAGGVVSDVAGGLGDAVTSVADVGKNTQRVTPFSQSAEYDPSRFNYGGAPGFADEAAGRYRSAAEGAQGRQAAQANYAQANGYAGLGLDARGQQAGMAGLMAQRAQGITPSIAGMQAGQDMQRAMAAHTSMAASARGAGGLALAQQQAANGVANSQGMISGQAQINAANERLAAEQGAFGAYGAMRGGDVASQQVASQQAQYNAGLQQQQRGMNDAYSLGMTNNEMGVRQQQGAAAMGQQQMLANNSLGAQTQQATIGQNNANMDWTQLKGLIGGGQGAADMGSQAGNGSDDRMKSGLTPLSGYGSSDELKMGLMPLGNVPTSQPAPMASWKDVANQRQMSAGMLTGMSAGRVQQIQHPTGQINSFDPNAGSGFLSDDRAKNLVARQAFTAGAQAAMQGAASPQDYERMGHRQRMYASQLENEGEDSITVRDGLAPPPTNQQHERLMPGIRRYYDDQDRFGGGGDSVTVRDGMAPAPTDQQPDRLSPRVRKYYEDQEREGDMTAQLAHGLAPYAYEYKPGMGPPGAQVGPRAQLMASQPATATAVTTRPDGLMQIDPAGGTKTALAGVGQLAQDMQSVKAYLASLRKDQR